MKFFIAALKICLINLNIANVKSFAEETVSSLDTEEAYSKTCTNFNTTPSNPDCPSLQNVSLLTQTQLIYRLTAPCRYDRLQRPFPAFKNECLLHKPLDIFVRIHIYGIQINDSHDLQLKLFGIIQLRYIDFRLDFGVVTPNSKFPIFGDSELMKRIWIPHILFENEQLYAIMGSNDKDVLTTIMPDGKIVISSRIQPTLLCGVSLARFPFDDQHCSALLESWMFNSSDVSLHWEVESPFVFKKNIGLSGYNLQKLWYNETVLETRKGDLRHEVFVGNFSSLRFVLYLTRDSEFYLMDYFVPSIMLVAVSWVSFWLQADQTPARTTLGTSTMLSFITLTSNYERNFQRFSTRKLFKIWFFGCTFFIFGSLIEFAFVNTIWRRNRCLHLKKINSKHIFKSTLTPKPNQKKTVFDCQTNGYLNNLTKNIGELQTNKLSIDIAKIDGNKNKINQFQQTYNETLATMTPHEVSLWIDRKARFVFPLSFIIFNAIFWVFMICL